MNKKILIVSILSTMVFTAISFKKTSSVTYGSETINFDVNTIQALSHNEGVTVNFVNDDIKQYWNINADDISSLRDLYEMNTEISSFAENAFDKNYVRSLYEKWDDFKPVNNTLTWKSNVRANTYDIVVSYNAELTEAMYEEKGLTTCQYTLINPYANKHYFWQVTAHTDYGDVKSSIFDFYSGDYKRTVDIPSVSNTRDIGGFTSKYGTMLQGLIYRSGRLDDITAEGKAALAKLNIQTDLDLRNKGEGKENAASLPNYYSKTLISYSSDFTDANRAKTVEAMRVFANPDNYPLIFHCAVGRDRTGTLAMLLQALCGASKEYIIHDYYTSMWSVTGAYQKTLDGLNLTIVKDTLDKIESFGTSINDGAEKFLKEKEDPETHEMIGLSDDEIKMIRDIFSGKVEVKHAVKSFKAQENYEGKAFVKIKTLGKDDVSMMVNKGTTIKAPYDLDDGLAYYSNGTVFDFTKPIKDTTYIYADYLSQYIVVIHYVGINKEDEILKVKYGTKIDFSKYEVSGYSLLVISDSGKEISLLNVTRDAFINAIYTKK